VLFKVVDVTVCILYGYEMHLAYLSRFVFYGNLTALLYFYNMVYRCYRVDVVMSCSRLQRVCHAGVILFLLANILQSAFCSHMYLVSLVLPFWYRLTRVVPDKGPLNVCVCVFVSSVCI